MSSVLGDVEGEAWTAIDLFAGAGGMSTGFARAGFAIVAGVETDADAAATYRRAHPEAKLHESDIAEVDFSPYRETVDVVIGGPPCQPWSLGGLRNGQLDKRDGFPQFLRALRDTKPRAFVMENVSGLVRGATRSAFNRLLECLSGELPLREMLPDCGSTEHLRFRVTWRVLAAQDYGVPQNRRRLFLVGTRDDAAFDWPAPTHGPGCSQPWQVAGDVLSPYPLGEVNPSIVTYAKNPTVRPDPYHGQIYNGGGRPIDMTRPAPTLLASMGGNKTPWVDGGNIVHEYHAILCAGGSPRAGQVPGARRITVDEAALLQTFPTGYGFVGSRSSRYRQIGNAVPPVLASAVATRLAAHLDTAAD